MDDLHIAGSDTTPTIEGIRKQGTLTMRGDSYPENAFELFSQVTDWVRRFFEEPQPELLLEIQLNYLNTSSVKAMVDIFELLEVAHRNACKVEVKWFCEANNERAAEVAEEFKEDCSFPFLVLPLDDAAS
jgi:hypothetical protein